jgi:hypothetical protein
VETPLAPASEVAVDRRSGGRAAGSARSGVGGDNRLCLRKGHGNGRQSAHRPGAAARVAPSGNRRAASHYGHDRCPGNRPADDRSDAGPSGRDDGVQRRRRRGEDPTVREELAERRDHRRVRRRGRQYGGGSRPRRSALVEPYRTRPVRCSRVDNQGPVPAGTYQGVCAWGPLPVKEVVAGENPGESARNSAAYLRLGPDVTES